MHQENRKVKIFIDNETVPIAEYQPPVKFSFDTTRLVDGPHTLKIVATSTDEKEGIRLVNFTVRNGPSITLTGLKENDVVQDKIPILINAYGSERKDIFVVSGSETPRAVPAWVWVLLIGFLAWAGYYLIMFMNQPV